MTFNITSDYTIGVGQSVTFTPSAQYEIAYELNAPVRMSVLGTLTIHDATPNNLMTGVWTNQANASLYIGSSGVLTVSQTAVGGESMGFYAGWAPSSFQNDGTFSVSGPWGAEAVIMAGGAFTNTGSFTMSGLNGIVQGAVSSGYVQASNSGSISVSGPTARALVFTGGGSLTNSGSITATKLGGGSSVGIAAGDQLNGVFTINNTSSGTITADTAVSDGTVAGHILLTNSGTINGAVNFGYYAGNELHNTGVINGVVTYLGTGEQLYDGRGGSLSGMIVFTADPGASATDVVYLGNDGETVQGGSSRLIATGGTGADTIIGGSGNDAIDGGGGNDVLDGGTGINIVSYASAVSGVTVSLALQGSGQNTIGAGTETLTHFQNLMGSAFNDTLTGDANDNDIDGGAGDDVIDGGGGVNTISYGSASGGVSVSLAITAAQNTGGAGTDTLSNFQNIAGSVFDDTLEGDGGNNVLNGGAGTNTLSYAHAASGVSVSLAVTGAQNTGGAGTDTVVNFQNLTGSAYNDTLEGDGGANVLNGGLGINTLTYAHAGAGVTVSLTLQGQAQSTGGAGTDTLSNFQNLIGSAFNDSLQGDANNNVLDGGSGTNTVSYASAAAGVTVSLALQGSGQNTVGAGTDTLSNFQNLTGSAFADHLTGDANNNVIEGGAGDDALDGAGGVNTASYAHAGAGVTVSLALQGQAQNTGGAGTDTLSNFQNLSGAAFDDTLEGDGANNVLDGGAGTNTVSYAHAASGVTLSLTLQGQAQNTVGAGTDTLSNFQNVTGSAFNDTLEGDGGANVLNGGAGTNTLSYAHAASGVSVSLAVTAAQNTGCAGTDTLSNFQNLTGSAFNDTLEGDGGANVLDGAGGTNTVSYAHAGSGVTLSLALQGQAQNTGGAGTDTLSNFQNLTGSAFDDTLEGDGGANVLNGGAGTNTVSYAHAASGVTVSLAQQGSAQNTVGAGTDTLSSFQNLTGSAFADRLTDDFHDNVLTGGAGADTFVLGVGGADTIADFSHAGGDKIDLTGFSRFYSLADVLGAATQIGADTVISTGSGSLTLKNVAKSSLTTADFQFGAQVSTHLHINVTYDASVSHAPAGFTTAVQAAVDFFQQTFTNNQTININFGWGALGGDALDPGALGESSVFYSLGFSYQAVLNALARMDASSPAAALAIAALSSSNPTGGGLAMTTAEARALGLSSAGPSVDGYIGLSSSAPFTFDPNNRAVTGSYDAIGALEHEISEVLGRAVLTGDTFGGRTPYYSPLDLFRYASANVHTYQPGQAIFSLNGDQTLEIFNNEGNGGDGGDWASGAQPDSFDAFGSPGRLEGISAADVRVMQLLGYTVSLSALTPNGAPSLPVFVSQSRALGAGQTLSLTGPAGIVFSPTSATVAPAYTNAGTISDSGAASQIDVIGVGYDPGATAVLNQGLISTFTNTATGVLTVNAVAAGSDAVGVYFGPRLVHNAGSIQVASAAADAFGDLGVSYTGDPGGSLTVQAPNEAIGLYLTGGVSSAVVSNAGAIQVSGLYAYGVLRPYSLSNTGSITATAAGSGGQSVGVYVGATGQTSASITNSGVITAQTALEVAANLPGLVTTIVNTGTINGEVDLGNGVGSLDSHLGRINGPVFAGAGFSNIALGAEDNTVLLAGGTHIVNAGGGLNTASYASASRVNVSLALQGSAQDTGAGSDTLSNFQNLTGSAFNDRLAGDAGANVLTGGAGADAFMFKPGDGHDAVSDFSRAQGDRIDLSAFHLRGFADALSHAAPSGADTVLTFGADQMVLQGVTMGALTAQDLIVSTASHDVTGTGYSALVFRDSGGAWGYAAFNSSGGYGWTPMGGSTASYGLTGTGDFNGDGVSDLLFREGPTGNWGFAQMNGAGGYVWNFMGGSTASYGEVGIGDVNGDGVADIIFREQSTGAWGFAEMHGNTYVWHPMGGSTASYSLAGTGDFNGDGIADILFRENGSGAWGFAEMHGTSYVWHPMGGSTASYSVAGTGDFNGDGTSDILFRDNRTGDWGYAQMHGASYAWLPMGGSTASYSVAGTGDYNGDGVADIAFREAATGAWGYAAMHGTSWDWHPMGGSTASYGAF